LGPTTTPEQAKAIYDQLSAIQQRFQQSGEEQFLMQGGTRSMLGGGGRDVEAGFEQGPGIVEGMLPLMSAQNLGLLRAIDIMARGGMDISGTSYPYLGAAASSFGSNATYRDPESGSRARGAQYNPYVAANYGPAYMATQGMQYDPNTPLTNETPWYYGGPEGRNLGPNFSPAWSPQAMADFAAIQPGHWEEGLAKLFGGQFTNPMYQMYGFGTGQVPMPPGGDPATQAIQQYMQQLQALQGQLPQLAQAAQVAPTQGLEAGALQALQSSQAPGFGPAPSSGGGMNSGVDLMQLLRQMGYAV
jgi:hypothetical protein